jgi:hypothetical protein
MNLIFRKPITYGLIFLFIGLAFLFSGIIYINKNYIFTMLVFFPGILFSVFSINLFFIGIKNRSK